MEKPPSFLKQYLYVLNDRLPQLFGMIGLFFFISLMDLLGISLIGPFIALITRQASLSRLAFISHWINSFGGLKNFTLWFGAGLVVMYVVKNIAAFLIFRRTLDFGFKVRAEISMRLARAYMSMPYRFYLQRNSASLVQSVINDTKSMSDDLLIPSLRLVSDSIVIVMIFMLLCWVDPRGVLVSLGVVGTGVSVYIMFVRPRARQAGTQVNKAFEQIIKRVNQSFWSVKEIRILGVERQFLNQMSADVSRNAEGSAAYFAMMSMPRFMMEAVVVILVILLSLISVMSGEGQTAVIPSLATFAAAGLRILPALNSIGTAAASIYYSGHALERVYEDLHFVAEQVGGNTGEGKVAQRKPFEDFTFDNVTFRYEGAARPALDNISFSVRRGQSIGLIGTTGAGKSTLVDAMLGFHDIRDGHIRVDGQDIESYSWERWRNQVAYLPQNVAMLDDTIEANIAFGIPQDSIDRDKVREAVRAAQLDPLIDGLPDGLATVIGDRGTRLSGGERQRIALARGFYFDRDVFILDEATSSLDPETERQVIDVINKLHGQKTLIVIAHRLSTVRHCDIVCRLEGGRIVKQGTFTEVVPEIDLQS